MPKLRSLFWATALSFLSLLLLSQSVAAEAVRNALVVGVGNYSKLQKLANSIRDAEVVSEALLQLGFEVVLLRDPTEEQLRIASSDYAKRASRPNTISIFYFSGHGAQRANENFLFGRDYGDDEAALQRPSSIQKVLSGIESRPSSFNIFVFDACREFQEKLSHDRFSPGFQSWEAPPNSLIAFATAPGLKASGGVETGGLSLYTKHLVREISSIGLPITEVFSRVHYAVLDESKGTQKPWTSSSFSKQLFLRALPRFQALRMADAESKMLNADVRRSDLERLYDMLDKFRPGLKTIPSVDEQRATIELLNGITGIAFSIDEIVELAKTVRNSGARFVDAPQWALARLGVTTGAALVVHGVVSGSAAFNAGVREGDVLVSIDDVPISSLDQLRNFSNANLSPGNEVEVVVFRNRVAQRITGIVERSSVEEMILDLADTHLKVGNSVRALELARWAGDRGSGDANVFLANLAANGIGTANGADYVEMIRRAKLADAAGSLRGKFWLMVAALRGLGQLQDFRYANEIRMEAARQGAIWAIAGLGLALLTGQGVEKNPSAAKDFLEQAAYLGHFDGMLGLGLIFEHGVGVAKDPARARQWYERAIQTGNKSAIPIARAGLQRVDSGEAFGRRSTP